jgi:transcriptional regulator with XRE-family HTH domain
MEILDARAIYVGRESEGLTQRQVGTLCGVSHTTIGKIERGEIKTVSPRLAGALNRHLKLRREGVFGDLPASSVPNDVPGTCTKIGVSGATP